MRMEVDQDCDQRSCCYKCQVLGFWYYGVRYGVRIPRVSYSVYEEFLWIISKYPC